MKNSLSGLQHPSRQRSPVLLWTGLLFFLLFGTASPAAAYLTAFNSALVPVSGAPIVLSIPGTIHFCPDRGGRLIFKLRGALSSVTGQPITNTGNSIEVHFIINGVPQTLTFPFSFKSGTAQIYIPSLHLAKQDLVEIVSIAAKDQSSLPFAVMGLRKPGQHFSSAIIHVTGTPSPITFVPTQNSDTMITATSNNTFTLRLNSLTPKNAANNKAELELAINGGSQLVTQTFDIVNGIGIVIVPISLVNGDVVEVRRIDVYDANNDRFATLGVRILSPEP